MLGISVPSQYGIAIHAVKNQEKEKLVKFRIASSVYMVKDTIDLGKRVISRRNALMIAVIGPMVGPVPRMAGVSTNANFFMKLCRFT